MDGLVNSPDFVAYDIYQINTDEDPVARQFYNIKVL